jgi:hypothetical protein
MLIGSGAYFIFRLKGVSLPHRLLLLFIPVYIVVRLANFVPSETIGSALSGIVEPKRIVSLNVRLRQEELFGHKIFDRPVFGWGGYDRGRPIDPNTGEIVRAVDSLWVIIASSYGFVGLCSFMWMMLYGPWKLFKLRAKEANIQYMEPVVLSLVIVLFMIDCLLNAMLNPVYILISGSLLSYYYSSTEELKSVSG